MTLEEAKNAAAAELGYEDWSCMYNWVCRDGQRPDVVGQLIESAMERSFRILSSKLKEEARECRIAFKYWEGSEFKDGYSGHKIEKMRPYLIMTSLCNMSDQLP